MLANIIIGAVIVLIIGLAIFKIVREKRAGNKCIGCPYGKECTSCPSEDYKSAN